MSVPTVSRAALSRQPGQSAPSASATLAFANPSIHTTILSHLPRSSLITASTVNREWFTIAAPLLYRHRTIPLQPSSTKPAFFLPFAHASRSSDIPLPGVEWARGYAFGVVRWMSIAAHEHVHCDDFVFPTCLFNTEITPSGERVIVEHAVPLRLPLDALRIEWRGWNAFILSCSFAEFFDPAKIVLYNLTHLTTNEMGSLPCISHPESRARKLVLLLDPPTGPPRGYPVYHDLPECMEQVVVYLRPDNPNAHAKSWGAGLAAYMRRREWGADVLARHFANMLLHFRKTGWKKRVTFVGCEQLDIEWVLDSTGITGAPGSESASADAMGIGGSATQARGGDDTLAMFEELVRGRIRPRWSQYMFDSGGSRDADDLAGDVGWGEEDVRFVTRAEYNSWEDSQGELMDLEPGTAVLVPDDPQNGTDDCEWHPAA